MPIFGKPKFDGVAVLQLEASFVQGAKLTAKAAYVDSKTGKTHGSTAAGTGLWSRTTLDALEALRAAMEADVAQRDFDVDPPTTALFPQVAQQGIGEHLNGDAQPL
jgi:hypothetical protein